MWCGMGRERERENKLFLTTVISCCLPQHALWICTCVCMRVHTCVCVCVCTYLCALGRLSHGDVCDGTCVEYTVTHLGSGRGRVVRGGAQPSACFNRSHSTHHTHLEGVCHGVLHSGDIPKELQLKLIHWRRADGPPPFGKRWFLALEMGKRRKGAMKANNAMERLPV